MFSFLLCAIARSTYALRFCRFIAHRFSTVIEFLIVTTMLNSIKHSCSVNQGRFSLSLHVVKRVAHRAKVRGVLHFQCKCQRAMDNNLDKVCQHGLAVSAINTSQHVLKVCAEACSVLAEWGWPCGLLRPRCRHGTSGAVGCCDWVLASQLASRATV
jgi:hypothetical protein